MYILRMEKAQWRFIDKLASDFPKQFRPDPEDCIRKMMITISKADASVLVEIVNSQANLPVEMKIGGCVRIDGQEIESDEKKMLVHSIINDLITAIDVISPHDQKVIAFHPTTQ